MPATTRADTPKRGPRNPSRASMTTGLKEHALRLVTTTGILRPGRRVSNPRQYAVVLLPPEALLSRLLARVGQQPSQTPMTKMREGSLMMLERWQNTKTCQESHNASRD